MPNPELDNQPSVEAGQEVNQEGKKPTEQEVVEAPQKETPELASEQKVEIERLTKFADKWIDMCQESLAYFGKAYPYNEWEQQINQQGAEAPKDLVEKYRWVKAKIQNHTILIQRLEDKKKLLTMGVLKNSLGETTEASIHELVDTLY